MCGIFGIIGNDSSAPQKVFQGLKDIEYRGYDSWGIAYLQESSAYPKNNSFEIIKDTGFLPKNLKLEDGNLALGHTRWATHGGVTKANAHPHSACSGKIVLVHNGIVENYLEIKKSLKTHKFKSQTDTEVVSHLVEELLEKNNLKQAMAKAFKKLKGLNAFVVSDGKTLIACKNSSPLVIGQSKDALYIASDPNAILPFTNNLYFLEDSQLAVLGKDLEVFSVSNLSKVAVNFTKVDWDYKKSTLDKFPHFMLKEIFEQPKVIRAISKNEKEIEKVANLIEKAYGTFMIGCGSASYAALSGVYLFSKFAKKHVNFSIGSEFNYIEHYLTPKSLLIAVSQSGETMDIIEPVKFAKEKKTKIVALTNVLGSSLYRMSNYPLLLLAGPEKAVCATKSFIAMLSNMIMLTFFVAEEKNKGVNILEKSSKEIERILENKEKIKGLANKISNSSHIYILGRGLSYTIALESALKIKEISYIHAEGFASGELKHGVIALVENGTPVIVFVPNDETKEATLANAMEVKARGAFVIGVGSENNEAFDFFFEVKDFGASSMLPNTVFAQLLAYYLSIKLGLNPDKPRNLAKSVVVR
ncbi:glutamine--fructose-6-phosphate transaminase (isomerizing) [Candidatus Daviesbacteria bacterium]|nr:glutamine--fructose-6-phosphate transaminase (isomerizing) [Candidatus Daviesbacteria bacterium]